MDKNPEQLLKKIARYAKLYSKKHNQKVQPTVLALAVVLFMSGLFFYRIQTLKYQDNLRPLNSQASNTVLPIVIINSPANDSTLPSGGSFTIAASASHPLGILRITLKFDGILLTTCTATNSCTFSPPIETISSGAHTITATAVDNSSNRKSVSSSVTVIKP